MPSMKIKPEHQSRIMGRIMASCRRCTRILAAAGVLKRLFYKIVRRQFLVPPCGKRSLNWKARFARNIGGTKALQIKRKHFLLSCGQSRFPAHLIHPGTPFDYGIIFRIVKPMTIGAFADVETAAACDLRFGNPCCFRGKRRRNAARFCGQEGRCLAAACTRSERENSRDSENSIHQKCIPKIRRAATRSLCVRSRPGVPSVFPS